MNQKLITATAIFILLLFSIGDARAQSFGEILRNFADNFSLAAGGYDVQVCRDIMNKATRAPKGSQLSQVLLVWGMPEREMSDGPNKIFAYNFKIKDRVISQGYSTSSGHYGDGLYSGTSIYEAPKRDVEILTIVIFFNSDGVWEKTNMSINGRTIKNSQ